jgi:hypothetical protein
MSQLAEYLVSLSRRIVLPCVSWFNLQIFMKLSINCMKFVGSGIHQTCGILAECQYFGGTTLRLKALCFSETVAHGQNAMLCNLQYHHL